MNATTLETTPPSSHPDDIHVEKFPRRTAALIVIAASLAPWSLGISLWLLFG